MPYMRAPSVRRCCTSYTHETDSWHSSVDDQLPRRACRNSGTSQYDDRDHNERRPYAQIMQRCCSLFQIVLFISRFVSFCGALPSPPGSVDVIPTAGCAQCAWCSLRRFVRACALGALFLRSHVRDSDVRTCVTGCVRVYGL